MWGQSGALGWGGDPCAALGERPGAMPPTQQGAAPQQGVPCAVNKAGIQPVLCAPRPAPHPTPAPWALRTQPHCAPLSPPNPPCSPHTLFPTFLSPLSPLGTSFKCPMCPLHPPPFSRCSDPHFFHPILPPNPCSPRTSQRPCRAQLRLYYGMRWGWDDSTWERSVCLFGGGKPGLGGGLSLPVVSVHGQRTPPGRHPRRCAARGALRRNGNHGW